MTWLGRSRPLCSETHSATPPGLDEPLPGGTRVSASWLELTIAGVRLRNSDKPFGLSGLGAIVVVIALYAVGLRLAFLIDVGLFLIPGRV